MYKKIALFALIVVLGIINWSIYQKEQHIENGNTVFLRLAPVDPRSLMQGDYMALRFDMANKIYDKLPKKENYTRWRHNADTRDGYVVINLDTKKRASFSSLSPTLKLVNSQQLILQYRVRNGAVKFATNAFFFEEGSAKKYEKAKYGEFRVNDKGELLLVGMADENVTRIE